MVETIQIDGSYGEGGGQIIRTSVSLAAITGRTVEISNVRARRSKPGLQPQHLAAVRAAGTLCDAEITNGVAGSTWFRFAPKQAVRAGSFRFDIGTAGATPLVAQTVLVPLTLARVSSDVTITGGTHVPHAPTAEYLETIYAPALRRIGSPAEIGYSAAGFFPRGGGELRLNLEGAGTRGPHDLAERGSLTSLTAYVITANLPDHVAQRGAAAVEKFMKGAGREVRTEIRRMPSPGQGAAVALVAECSIGLAAFSGLGERGKPMERVAEEPCREFMAWWKSGAACDEHLADQLVLPLALTPGESRWTTPVVTEHLRTVLWVAEQFLPIRYEIIAEEGQAAMISLAGQELKIKNEKL